MKLWGVKHDEGYSVVTHYWSESFTATWGKPWPQWIGGPSLRLKTQPSRWLLPATVALSVGTHNVSDPLAVGYEQYQAGSRVGNTME